MIRLEDGRCVRRAPASTRARPPCLPAEAPREQGLPTPSLTGRQRTVLEMLAEGKQARRIAAELHLSEMTVRNHIRAILREFGCNSQLSAVAAARRLGLV